MKKNYLFLAAATTLFAACVQTDVVNDIPEPQQHAISFETFANKQTRAENSSATTYKDLGLHHQTFEVYAYKNVSETKVFDNETVKYTAAVQGTDGNPGTPAKWSYSGQVYWDKAATEYNFYAAAPAEDYWKFHGIDESTDATPISKSTAYFTIDSHVISDHNVTVADDHEYVDVFGTVTKNNGDGSSTILATDLMIAEKEQVTKESSQTLFEPVQLNFIHILSRLNITVSKDASLSKQVVTLNSLTVHNLKGTAGFNENLKSGTDLSNGTTGRWTNASTPITYTSLASQELSVVDGSNPAKYMLQSLVIPQTAGYEDVTLAGPALNQSYNKPYFIIKYTIKEFDDQDNVISSEDFTAYYNLANAFGITSGSLAFNEGWQNTLNITISPEAITFTADAAVWADHDFAPDNNSSLGGDIEIE